MNLLIALLRARFYASVVLTFFVLTLALSTALGFRFTVPPIHERVHAGVLDDPTPTPTPTVYVDPRCPGGDCKTSTPTPTITPTSTPTPTPTSTPVVTADDLIGEPPPNARWFFPWVFQ